MDLSDLMDLIFTSEDDLRRMGAQGGPEARKLVEEAVAATKKARTEAEDAIAKLMEKAGIVKRGEVEGIGRKLETMEARIEGLVREIGELRAEVERLTADAKQKTENGK